MERIVEQMTLSDPLLIAAGATLLLLGRKLYWLALGGIGFLLGLRLAQLQLQVSYELELVLALAAGILGAVLAVMVQKIAVNIGGFAIGAILAYHFAQPWAADLDTGIWLITLVGALVGICFAAFVFNAALIVVSSVAGALLFTDALHLERPEETWTFVGLAILGIFLQTRGKKAPKDE